MSTAKDIVTSAYKYLQEVSPNADKFTNLRVEEISKDESGDWSVTLGYEIVGDFPFEKTKELKEFKVTDSDGVVQSMKIKKL